MNCEPHQTIISAKWYVKFFLVSWQDYYSLSNPYWCALYGGWFALGVNWTRRAFNFQLCPHFCELVNTLPRTKGSLAVSSKNGGREVSAPRSELMLWAMQHGEMGWAWGAGDRKASPHPYRKHLRFPIVEGLVPTLQDCHAGYRYWARSTWTENGKWFIPLFTLCCCRHQEQNLVPSRSL